MTVGYGILPDTVGVVNILPVSGFLGLGLCGKQVHGLCVITGLVEDFLLGMLWLICMQNVGKWKTLVRFLRG